MSHTVAYLIRPDGSTEAVAEFRNSHGFGPFVWNAVAEKYLGKGGGWMLDDSDKLWPLWKDMRLPRAWRASLLLTYDYAISEQARFKEIGGCLRQFCLDVGLRDRVCHLLPIADLLDKHAADKVRGMCFYGTSLSENLWHPWDDEKDEPLKYDFDAPGKHFHVGEALDKSEVAIGQRPGNAP